MSVRTDKRELEIKTCFCDICDKAVGSYYRNCRICKKDLCRDCSVVDWRDDILTTDYPGFFCSKCYEIGKPFIERYKQEEEKSSEILDEIMSEWKSAVKGENQ